MSIKLVVGMALLNLILQAQGGLVPGGVLPPWIASASALTFQGGMAIAIVILWKAYQAKDALLLESTKAVTGALAVQAASNLELRGIIKESVEVNRGLKDAVDHLRVSISSRDHRNYFGTDTQP
jgi:hypothetical protein